MSGHDWGIDEDPGNAEPTIAENKAVETAALLSVGRQLIAEARKILSEAPTAANEDPVGVVFYQLLDQDRPSYPTRDGQATHHLARRLVAAVPAAAGIALLGAGLASLAGGHPQHALTLDVQGPQNHSSASTSTSAPTSIAPPAPQGPARPLEAPVSLSVPRLRSRAAVAGEVYVQASGPESGLLDAPSDYRQLGWYRHGNTGALVLDGHVGYRTNPGPLAFIGSLGAGDVVIVGFPAGDRAFSVTVVGRVVKGQLPQQYFSDQYDGDLMLITCDYTSPFRAGHFQDNVYLVAVPSQ